MQCENCKKEMQCQNCNKEVPVEDWVFTRAGGPSGRYFETIAAIAHGSEAVFCSEKCMRKKQAADHQKKTGY